MSENANQGDIQEREVSSLPPLPTPDIRAVVDDAGRQLVGHSQAQTIAYAQEAVAQEKRRTATWRHMAMQFDAHRMKALWYLCLMLSSPKRYENEVRKFLEASPPESQIEKWQSMCRELLQAMEHLEGIADRFSVSGVYFNEFPSNRDALDGAAAVANAARDLFATLDDAKGDA